MKSSQYIKIIIFILYLLFIKYSHFLVAKKNQSPKFTLLVIAHPDDEIMFFSPFLLNNKDTFILCLSGDETRKKELNLISKYLKIKHKCINFADGSNWNEKLICFFIQNIYNKYKFERIVTFDSYGVSGHKNHISCFEGVRLFLKNNKVECLFLRSVSLLQKYGLIYSKGNIIFTNSFMQYFYAVKLMFLYKSQLKWFRILWLIFSNFMFVNIFDK